MFYVLYSFPAVFVADFKYYSMRVRNSNVKKYLLISLTKSMYKYI